MSEREKISSSTTSSSSKLFGNSGKNQNQQQNYIYESNFDYTLPRPPVVGEERQHCTSETSYYPYQMDRQINKSSHHHHHHHHQQQQQQQHYCDDEKVFRPLSMKQGNNKTIEANAPSPTASTPVPCLKWAHSLDHLLKDTEGAKLFLKFLESEGQQHADALHFWFACEGLNSQNNGETLHKLVKAIYRTYLMKPVLPINDELRKEITQKLKSPKCLDPPVTLFDEAQAQVFNLINNTTYPNFLKSDMYLQYLQSVQNPCSDDYSSETSSSSSSSISNKDLTNMASGLGPLPTLHEDMELIMNPPYPLLVTPGNGNVSTGYHTPSGQLRLTKDVLLMSQKHRAFEMRPKSEPYAGLFTHRGGVHAAYNSYNPVSRQDSEMQSLSSHSDARTESDNLSIADGIFENRHSGRSRHKTSLETKNARELAALNKETDMHQTFIPRTQRMDIRKCIPMNLDQHAAILKEKLENVKREQEIQEMFDRKLKESDSICNLDDNKKMTDLDTAIKEKLQFHDDNDQDILDEHVSRVFSESTQATSPGLVSPLCHSPLLLQQQQQQQQQQRSKWLNRPKRRIIDKDGFSTFSGDSGNVHDYQESLTTTTTTTTATSMIKSKSMPEYGDERCCFIRNSSCRRSSSKKTLTDLTDSGVSVVSDTPPVIIPAKENRVLTWLMESDKSGRVSHTHSEMSMKHRSSATSPNTTKHKKYGSRSSSLERNSGVGNAGGNVGSGSVVVVGGGGGISGGLGPNQPFIADPSMPPPPLPDTIIQLEEARRRLMMEDNLRTRSRQRSTAKYYPDLSQSSQSTLRKSMRQKTSNANVMEEMTTVVFTFCDEQFPYRTKIPGSQITLRQFKDYLPKKGNYRYFFKTVCEDLDNQVTNEEIINDSEILPLWEGKIMAQVKPLTD